jgi:hypothetical protein
MERREVKKTSTESKNAVKCSKKKAAELFEF